VSAVCVRATMGVRNARASATVNEWRGIGAGL
jgi:hypothetical protein